MGRGVLPWGADNRWDPRAMAARFYDPKEEELDRIERMEEWVASHFAPDRRHLYQQIAGKIAVVQAIVDNGWIIEGDPIAAWKRQALGATVGAALAQYYEGLVWKAVEDENGRAVCLVWNGTAIQVNPLTMISKRLERGDPVQVRDLMAASCEAIDRARQKLSDPRVF